MSVPALQGSKADFSTQVHCSRVHRDSIRCVIIISDVLELLTVLGSGTTVRDKSWAVLWWYGNNLVHGFVHQRTVTLDSPAYY